MNAGSQNSAAQSGLLSRLNLFDAVMIVMGGIIGAGIFVNPSIVARQVHTPGLIIGAWVAGGAIALIGAFIYAELAALRPEVGGQYAYLRDAYHPMIAFLYGWTLLLVVQSGGMAACAIIFGRYFRELTGWVLPEQATAAATLAILTFVNCFGVRAGSNVQSFFMLCKLVAIAMLIAVGWLAIKPAGGAIVFSPPVMPDRLSGFATAMVPVLFAYGGWQTASFMSSEMRQPRRDLPRGLLIGVLGVITLYVTVAYVCLRVLGMAELAQTNTPASEVMRLAMGQRGAQLIAVGIAVSTLGFLSQSILTAPRVYYAMARDGLFFATVARVHPKTHVPIFAIILQGVWATVIALTGTFDQILNYVESIDLLFFGLTAASLFIFRARARSAGTRFIRVPGHPVTTGLFVLVCSAVAITTIVQFPQNAGIGVLVLVAGGCVYWLWRRQADRATT